MTKIKKDPRSYKKMICSMAWDEKSIQKSGDGALTVVGYANTKGKDRVGDVVLPEAFTKTLPTYMDNPMLLYMHDWDKVAGKVIHAEIDEKGLKVKARISGAKDCEDVRTKINEGVLSTFSIGYNEVEAEWDKSSATNLVKEVELLEISIVSIPCNTEAKFEPVEEEKSDDPKEAPKTESKSLENEILTLLKDESMSKSELEALIKKLRGETAEIKTDVEAKADTEEKTDEESAEEKTDEESTEEKTDESTEEKSEDGEQHMRVVMERLDMISEGLASVLEMVAMMGAEAGKMDAAEEDEEEEEEEKSSDDEEDEEEEKTSDSDDEEKDLEDMSDEEGIALLEELSEELEA